MKVRCEPAQPLINSIQSEITEHETTGISFDFELH